MADAESKLQIVVGANTEDAEQKLGGFGNTLGQIGKIAAGIGLERLAEGAIAFGKDFVTSSVEAYSSSQTVIAQLDAVLKSTAGVVNQGDKYVMTAGMSASKQAELNDELVHAKARLADMEDRWNSTTKHTQTAGLAIQDTKNKIAELEGKLSNTGGTMVKIAGLTQMTRDQLIGLSKELESVTTFSDEEVLSAENLLLTFTNIGKTVFPQATKTVLDMAVALGEDTKSASIQLGKALQDPILGVSALRRVGVNFSDDQKEVIKTLVDSGKTLDAQKMILKELSTEFGGSAAAAANTYAGRMKQMKETMDDLKEIFGKFIVDALNPLTAHLKPILDIFLDFAEKTNNWKTTVGLLTKEVPVLGGVIGVLTNVYNGLSKTATAVFNVLNKLWNAHKTEIMAALDALMPYIQGTLNSLWQLFQIIWSMIGIYVKGALTDLIDFWNVWGAGLIQSTKGILEFILSAIKLGLDLITGILNIFVDLYKGNWKKFWKDVWGTTDAVLKDIAGLITGFGNFVMGIINGIISAINSIGSKVSSAQSSVGKRASGGIASGLTLVGENGPELVSLPVGSYVYKNSDTQRMMGNYAPVININNPTVRNSSDIQAIAAEVQRVLGRQNELARLGGI